MESLVKSGKVPVAVFQTQAEHAKRHHGATVRDALVIGIGEERAPVDRAGFGFACHHAAEHFGDRAPFSAEAEPSNPLICRYSVTEVALVADPVHMIRVAP